MSRGVANVLRGLTAVAALGVVFMIVRLVNPPPAVEEPEEDSQALTVVEALNQAGSGPVEVQGYVFLGGGWSDLRLCQSRRAGDPPGCIGPFLYLAGVERTAFDMDSGEGDDGEVYWSRGRVVVRGTLVGTEMTVGDVFVPED